MFGPLSTDSFGKMIQVQEVSFVGINNLSKFAQIMADKEGLDAHKNSINIRLKMINNLIRPNIVKMKPYVCARDLYQEGVLWMRMKMLLAVLLKILGF